MGYRGQLLPSHLEYYGGGQMTLLSGGQIYIFLPVLSMTKLQDPCSNLSCLVKWCGGIVRCNSPTNTASTQATALCPLQDDFLCKNQQVHTLIRLIIAMGLKPVIPRVSTRGLSGHVSSRWAQQNLSNLTYLVGLLTQTDNYSQQQP